ncbi:MAG: putative VID27 null [Streblomastix strix]|nr:MAG: putative VID27 null [Streblomastix strix]
MSKKGSGTQVPLPSMQQSQGGMDTWTKLLEVEAALFVFSVESGSFENVEQDALLGLYAVGALPDPKSKKKQPQSYEYNLVVRNKNGELLLLQKINSDMHLYFVQTHSSIVWVTPLDGAALTMSATVKGLPGGQGGEPAFNLLRREFTIRLWETQNKLPFSRCEEADFIIQTLMTQQNVGKEKEKDDDDDSDFEGRDEELEKAKLNKKEIKQLQKRQYNLRRIYEEEKEEEKEKDDDDDDEEEEEEEEKKGGIRVSQIGASQAPKKKSKNDPNKLLIVGQRVPRSFVVKQSGQLDIFSTASGMDQAEGAYRRGGTGVLSAVSTVPVVKTLDDTPFTPSKALLYQGNRQLLLLNPDRRSVVSSFDVERGKVVEEWKTNNADAPIDSLTPSNKGAPQLDEQTFLGINKNQYFVMDPRIASAAGRGGSGSRSTAINPCIVDGKGQQYASSTRAFLTSGATTNAGQLAIGSAKGDIRLFDNSLQKRAKTLIPGFGDPIIGMDVSQDGLWIVATTPTYLLVLNTELPTSSEAQKIIGFDKSIPKDGRKAPVKLQLDYKDVIRLVGIVSFTPAKFNYDPQTLERTIVTSTGPFIITWNFRSVKLGKVSEYRIKRLTDTVIDGHFAGQGNVQSVVVAMENTTAIENISGKATEKKGK